MWSDNETTEDFLGFKVHAELIKSVILDKSLLPVTIGVFGDWGSGKTSVLKMLLEILNPESFPQESSEKKALENIACIYINGWLFEGYDDAKAGLLSSVLNELQSHKKFNQKLKDKAISLMKSVNWMRLLHTTLNNVVIPTALAFASNGSIPPIVGTTAINAISISSDDVFKKKDEINGQTEVIDIRSFRTRFSELLRESNIDTLVILIDDLDRCSPQRLIDNLEAVKLFLSVENTAFIIGADPRIVRHAISTIYKPEDFQEVNGKLDEKSDIVTDYLEKMIQIPYYIPRLSPTEVQTYMSLLFCHRYLPDDASRKIIAALQKHKEKDRYTVFGFGAIKAALDNSLPSELDSSLKFCEISASLITEGLKGNPRQIKRFLNAYILRMKLAKIAHLESIEDSVLVKLMILEYVDGNLFNQLYLWQSQQDGFPRQIKELEKLTSESALTDIEKEIEKITPGWNSGFSHKWLAMEPLLAEKDLRDYFWIARDRLQSTLSGVSLVPPIVRHVFEGLLGNELKQNEAINMVRTLNEMDINSLVNLLTSQIERHPEQEKGYEAFLLLINENISNSLTVYSQLLLNIPANSIPPAIGYQIQTLIKGSTKNQAAFAPVIEYIKKSKSKVAATFGKDEVNGHI
jgi:predicted KAP-like P-loop ATPase